MTANTEIAGLDYDTLESAAKDGSMDYEKWPALLEPLLLRLTEIVQTDFPIPSIPDSLKVGQSSTLVSASQSSAQPRHDAPNTTSTARSPRSLPPVPAFDSSAPSTATSRIPESNQATENVAAPDLNHTAIPNIPDQLISQLTSIQSTLRSAFSEKPPHTIQRLAELVISPRRHYKTLPAWLRAVDRVVSVSSPADIFPLPHAQPLPNSIIDTGLLNGLVNGEATGAHGNGGLLWSNSDHRDNNLGSDESLGGALLTPIPWLQHRSSNGDDDPDSALTGSPDLSLLSAAADSEVPVREDGGVTQGELIRMEQEAGIVPVNQGMGSAARIANGDDGDARMLVDEDAPGAEDVGPHARGPDVVGVEDMGLQNGQGVELQLSRGAGETEDSKRRLLPAQTEAQPQAELKSSGAKQESESEVAHGVEPTENRELASDGAPPAQAAATSSSSSSSLIPALPSESEHDKEGDIVLSDADGTRAEGGREKQSEGGEDDTATATATAVKESAE